ncbi:Small-conductance mechanosensitive channel [Fodinibius salinus]|uniref:Small-conductance mechanosensitive channel n=1 Tax=Fodinibius salinus TaxID=860790 RepID=A0A5D3YM87_9BACT|nr:mechanosensitive ion channel domain-containing protein [Fodinibius salinus]TYP93791.1 Small-conductance mechanosensitive channel [Fodinibius salinus]
MENFTSSIQEFFLSSPELTKQILLSLVVIISLWIMRHITIRIVNRNISETKIQYKWRKNLTYLFVFIGVLIVGRIWFEGLQSLATFFGLLTAGLAIALKDPISDIAGWIFILWRQPFEVGDRIEVDGIKGDVIDTRLFKFSLLEIGNWVGADQSTGRIMHVPNHKVFSDSLANYTSDFKFVWNELQVLLTFESDWKKAKALFQEIAENHVQDFPAQAEQQVGEAQMSYLIYYQHLTPIVYTDVQDSGVCLTIRHPLNPRKRRGISEAIWEDLLQKIEQHDDIELAYPTMRIYQQPNR